jgi:hypothetical protein
MKVSKVLTLAVLLFAAPLAGAAGGNHEKAAVRGAVERAEGAERAEPTVIEEFVVIARRAQLLTVPKKAPQMPIVLPNLTFEQPAITSAKK